jgi:hypothetical protein
LPKSNSVADVPNHILVEDPFVYVANAGAGTLQILKRTSPLDGLELTSGVTLTVVAELPLGANTYPEGVAKLNQNVYVPLYGGSGASASAGGKVVRIDVSNPSAPAVTKTFNLNSLDLKPFPGGNPVPRPYAITLRGGMLYVALNNLDPSTYEPEGPGMLARIDPVAETVTAIDLGADACLNAVWVASSGTRLLVSCAGKAFDVNGDPISTERTGLVLLDENDVRLAFWNAAWQPVPRARLRAYRLRLGGSRFPKGEFSWGIRRRDGCSCSSFLGINFSSAEGMGRLRRVHRCQAAR